MLIILNFGPTPLTPTQRQVCFDDTVARADPRFRTIVKQNLKMREIMVPRQGTPTQTVAAIPLSPAQWGKFPFVVFIPFEMPDAQALMAEVNPGWRWMVLQDAREKQWERLAYEMP